MCQKESINPKLKSSRSNRADNRALERSGLAQSATDGNLQLLQASTGPPKSVI